MYRVITALESYTAVQAKLEEAGVRIDREGSGLQLMPLALVEVGVGVGEDFRGRESGIFEFWNSGMALVGGRGCFWDEFRVVVRDTVAICAICSFMWGFFGFLLGGLCSPMTKPES